MVARFRMDGTAIARFFKVPNRRIKQWLLFSVLILVVVTPTFLAHIFLWKIERRLNLKVYHKPFFILLPGRILLRPAALEWQDHLRVRSGTLLIHYPWWVIGGGKFSVFLQGENLEVEFGPEFQNVLGQEDAIIDRARVKFWIQSKRVVDVEFLKIESKTIQFQLDQSTPERK
ncbi:MAG: hypothetical protein HY584_05265 [Candidatus Omnitrophica bacterium]|nr:hypothetical protein [Candidatus Omnitrophota bacterium]